MNVTDKQKKIILNYMKENPDFARGRLRYNSANKRILDDMWSKITNSLNAIGSGPQKQAKEWQKTWRDWKANVLKKCTQNKSYAAGTGGGPPKIIPLTQIEEELLEILNLETIGLENVPQGGAFNRMAPTTIQKKSFEETDDVYQGDAFNKIKERSLNTTFPQGESLIRNVQGGKETHASVAILTCTQTKRKCTSTPNAVKVKLQKEAKNSTCLSTVVSNDFNYFASDLDFRAQETELPDDYIDISDTDIIIEQQQVNVVADGNRSSIVDCIPDRTLQNKDGTRNQNSVKTAVELMREKINILREHTAHNKQMQERRNEIEEEKLKILRENLALKKANFEHYKSIFTNIDENLRCLKDEVEKLVPSYLI